jgi:hypothetical protein
MSNPTTFQPFPSLPPEIRTKIYNHALNCPRIVQLYLKRTPLNTSIEPHLRIIVVNLTTLLEPDRDLHRLVALSSHAIHPLTGALNNLNPSITTICLRPHALLSVNKESRDAALNLFTPHFQNRAFVDPESDTFYLQDTSAFRLIQAMVVPRRNNTLNSRTNTRIPARLARAEIASKIQYLALPLSSLFPDGSQHTGPEQTVKAISKMTELREVLVVFHVKEDAPGSHQGVKFLEVSSEDFKGDVEGEIVPTRAFWGEEVEFSTFWNAEFMVEHFLVLLGRVRGNKTEWKEPVFKVVMARVPWKAKS